MIPSSAPSRLHRSRRLRLAIVVLALAACRTPAEPAPVTPEPEPPVAKLPTFPSVEPDLTPLDLSPDPLPEGVVAAVDGEPIFEAEIERLTKAAPPTDDPIAVRTMALVQLVERRLLLAKADQMDIRATEDDVQRAIDGVASSNGLTPEQLKQQVIDGGWTWEDYREDVVAQIVELKVLTVSAAGTRDPEALDALRTRTLGCMRARAEIQVGDDSLELPPNPFALEAKIEQLRFVGDVGLPEDELRTAAAEAAKPRIRLCDALTSAELALEELYLERGFLEAHVYIPWPPAPTPLVAVDVEVTAGRPHVIGTISFDQSAAPRSKRLDPKELQKRAAAFVAKGDVATMSAMQAAGEEIQRAFQQGGLGPVEATVDRKPSKKSVRVNITYRLTGSKI